jgi:hypothetical protein
VCAGVLWSAELSFELNRWPVNTTPPGFTSAVSGTGQPGEWRIILDEATPLLPPLIPGASSAHKVAVLAQLARDKTQDHFPLLIYDKEIFDDFKLTTRFKLMAGEVEQMAGIAFRLQDEKNYYYIRASGLGKTFHFYKMVNGQLSAPIGNPTNFPTGVWYELTIECRGTKIRGLLNGQEIIPPLDDPTFARGKIAFWTKSDSVSYFADTRIEYTPRVTLAEELVREGLTRYDRLLGLKIVVLTTDQPGPVIRASDRAEEVGTPAWPEERHVIDAGNIYYLKRKGTVTVSLPLRDRNGEPVAAVRVVMKAFPGQTEKNAVARAWPVVKSMEPRVLSRRDLLQ